MKANGKEPGFRDDQRLSNEMAEDTQNVFDLVASAPDGGKRLRELILSLAMHGKLVEQNPGDEPASGLLDRIAKLANSHPVSSSASVRAPLSELPFKLPGSWRWTTIGTLGRVVGGGTPKSEELEYWAEEGIPWLTPADLYGRQEKCIHRGRRDISKAGLENSSAQLLPKGTVLFSSRAPIGYVALAGNPLATNQGFKSCVPHMMELGDYLYWYLRYAAKGIDASASGTTFKEISGADFGKLPVPVPPLAEQGRIVARIEELMQLCRLLEENSRREAEQHARLTSVLFDSVVASESASSLATTWRQVAEHFDLLVDRPRAIDTVEEAILELAVRGRLVSDSGNRDSAADVVDQCSKERVAYSRSKRNSLPKLIPLKQSPVPFFLPPRWTWARLGELFLVITDGDHQPPPKSNMGIPFLTIGNISTGTIDFSGCRYVLPEYYNDIAEYRRPARGDILYTVVGATYGRPVRVDTDQHFCVQRHIAILKPTATMDREYLNLLLSSAFVYEQATRSITGTAQPTVGLNSLRNFIVPVPPLVEQHSIVSHLEGLRRLSANLRKRLTESQRTQSQLANALVSGAA